MKNSILYVLLFFFASTLYSQNLVKNPSFENNSGCPMGPSQLTLANSWTDPFLNLVGDTCSTSDYYHSCNAMGAFGVGVPTNIMGNEPARTGSAYAGIITYSGLALTGCTPMMSDGWREYVQGELTTTLIAGQEYCISFWVSLADNVKWASDKFGVYLSPTQVAVNCGAVGGNSDLSSYGITPQLNYTGPTITTTNGWVKLEFNYTATGGENYIVIGNFYNSSTTYTCVNASAINPYAYYYIDDVSVVVGLCCDATFTAPSPLCNTDPAVTLTPVTTGGTWSGTGVNASGVFNPATAGVGSHVITYTLPCGSSEDMTIVVNACVSLTVCKEANGSLTVSGGTGPYTWQNETTTQDCSACLVGCTFPPGCAVNVTGWTNFATGTNIPAPGTYPVQVLDNAGGSVIINSAASVTPCTVDPCASVTISVTTTPTQPTCTVSGSAIANATGGTGSYSYSWNTTPVQTTQTATNLSAGNYTVTVTDVNGCSGTATVTINAVPNAPTVSVTKTDADCSGTLGNATANATGGTGSYSYSWNTTPVQTTQTATNLVAGSYTVTVTDVSGCSVTGTIAINSSGGTISIQSVTPTQPSCPGVCDGSITVVATGGSGTYTYVWKDNVGNVVGTNSATLSNVCAGNYTVEVSENGGTGTQTIYTEDFESAAAGWNLNVPVGVEGTDPNFFAVNDNEGGMAPGGCGVAGNGDATLHITSVFNPAGGAAYDAGGLCGFLFCPETHRRAESPTINTTGNTGLTLKFNYIANGSIPNDQATVWYNDGTVWIQLGAALFSGTGGCAPQGVWTAYSQALPASCDNNPNLKIAIRWDNNDDGAGSDPSVAINNITIEAASGGTGCPITQATTLTDPTSGTPPSFTFANFCAGATNGPANISPTGGTFTFNPAPSDGATINASTGIISNATGGAQYTVQYSTTGACAQSTTQIVTVNSNPQSTATSTDATCTTGGSAIANATGGTGSYSYSWNTTPVQTTQTATNLAAGNYTVTVTDVNGCFGTASATINAAASAPTVSATPTQPTCTVSGSAIANATGGTGSYSYSWNTTPVQTTQTATNLAAGNYTVTVTDAGGCTGTATVTINPNTSLTLTTSSTQTSCTANTGTATVVVTVGTTPYSYSWNTTPVQTTQTANNLGAGPYTVTVTDGAGCQETATVSVTTINAPTASITSSQQVSCFGGSDGNAVVSATGGTGTYTYNWSPSGGTGATASGLTAGTYTATVTDGAGCSNTAQIIITQPTALTVTNTVVDASCGVDDGEVNLTVSGGTGSYTYVWTPAVSTSDAATGLAIGSYTTEVTDGNGCTATITSTVSSATTFGLDAHPDGTTIIAGDGIEIGITVETGIVVDSIIWTPATDLSCTDCLNPTASPTVTTTYYVTVINDAGCIATDSLTIYVKQPCGELFVPNMFSPNDDGTNDLECVMGSCVVTIDFTIFDRWGEVVFHTEDRNSCWDGSFRGKPVQTGVYVYKLDATLENGETVTESGNINVVR